MPAKTIAILGGRAAIDDHDQLTFDQEDGQFVGYAATGQFPNIPLGRRVEIILEPAVLGEGAEAIAVFRVTGMRSLRRKAVAPQSRYDYTQPNPMW